VTFCSNEKEKGGGEDRGSRIGQVSADRDQRAKKTTEGVNQLLRRAGNPSGRGQLKKKESH